MKILPAALLLLVQAQDPVALHWNNKKGDKLSRSSTIKTDLKGKRTVQGNPEDLAKEITECKRYHDEVLDVAAGEPSQVKRKVID